MTNAHLLYHCNDRTGEAATWLPGLNSLFWVDIDNGILHQYNAGDRSVEDHTFPEMITSIIPWEGHDKELILAMKNRFVAFHLEKKTYRTLVELTGLHPQWRTNDCKASPDGRIWGGIMHLSEHNGNGSLYCVDNDLSLAQVLQQQHIPNGIVWNREGDRMYYADSGRGCIEEYAYDRLTGSVCLLRTVVQVPAEYGVPDGMTIDAEGLLWVAHWGGYGVYVWNPANGQLVNKIEVPVPNVASCTFGGKEHTQLFITTAIDGLSEEELAAYPLSGSLFVADLPDIVPGENHYPFITGKYK